MKITRKRIIIGIVVIVVLGASAAAAMLFTAMQQQAEEAQQEASTGLSEHPAETKSDEADKLAYEGDVSEGVKIYDEEIASTEDPFAQFVFYSRKATLLFNDKDYDGALVAAQQAYDLQKTSDSAAFVGQIAREKGDRALALDNYKLALSLIDPTDPFADEDKVYYEGVIKELEAES